MMQISPSICTLLLLLLTAFPHAVFAQFSSVLTFGGAGNENGQQLISDEAGGFYIAGTFDAPFAPVDEPLPVYGQEDFFLGQLDATGHWIWIKSGGSFLNDELRVLRRMPNGDLLMVGTFWLEFTYDDLTLKTSDNIKGIFMVRLDALGNWQWGKVINGADLKEVNDVKIAPSGEIYLTGHFSEALQFDSLRLTAVGNNDAFLLKLDPDGDLLDWQQAGFRGTTRGQSIALRPDGGYYWGGVYDDTLRVDTMELYANTFDRDVFLIRYDPNGNPLWARRAGGVFEEELTAMTTDSEGNLLATGFLIGVMSFSESVSIQSRNGNPDIFLFKYKDTGHVEWARAIGGNLMDQPTSLCLLGEQLIIGGIYQQQVAWDGLSTPTNSGVNGFVAGFDQVGGAGNWLVPVTSENFAFVEALTIDSQGQLYALGSFQHTAQWGSLSVNSFGQYDFFLAGIAPAITPINKPVELSPIRVFPNPNRDLIFLEGLGGDTADIHLYDVQGNLIKNLVTHESMAKINLQDLPSGQYWLTVRQGIKVATLPVTVIK